MYKFIGLILFFMVSIASSFAQGCDYITQQYQVNIDSNVVYGNDTLYNLQTTDLKMHIYAPVGDNNNKRPVVIWLYGGAWVAGAKEDMADWCLRFAKRGYVAVTIQYRLGFFNDNIVPYIGNIPRPYGPEEPTRAAYRAQQDLKGAIRFIKGKKDIYKLDTSKVFVGGQSAGAITCLSAAFMNENSQKPSACGVISNYTNQLQGLNIKRPDLGPVEGRLNLNGCGTGVKGVINMFGAIFDTSWIKTANDISVFSYHQSVDYNTEDIVVSSYTKTFFWSLNLNYPWAHGSRIIQKRLTNLGYDSCHAYTYIYPGFTHGLHDESVVDLGIARLMNNIVCNIACFPLGVVEPELNNDFKVYPNPATNSIHISAANLKMGNIELYDMEGKVIKSFISNVGTSNLDLDISDLRAGIYLLKSRNNEGVYIQKFIKE
ncbi:MAG: T9SS type A sorting domain-containing protein [Bacteroidetes bacterium]|nr:T9SS type A sorting domain-containing protein [Bacteroidota bacterium]